VANGIEGIMEQGLFKIQLEGVQEFMILIIEATEN